MNILKLYEDLNTVGEQERVEAKSASKIGKSILETVCAYANEPDLGGGYLLLGISEQEDLPDRFHLSGVTQPEKLLEDLVSQCRTVFNKPVEVETKHEIIDGKIILGIFVPEVSNGAKPIYFKKRGLPEGAYRRMGSSDVKCTEDDLLMLYQNREIESYDASVVSDATWDDIDLDAIVNYRRVRQSVHSGAAELQWSDQDLLQSLGCVKQINGEIKITVAGVLLFGTRVCYRRLFPDTKIEYIRVPGNQWMSDPENRYTTSTEIRGPLMNCIQRAEASVIDDLPTAFSLPEGSLQRKDIPVIPFKVVREAVVNAVMHRDYRVHQAIQIIRYANRIEIRNPGYSLISEEHLGEPGSKSRNLMISTVLHDTQFAEKKGTGIGLMRSQMEEAGLSPPLFESDRSRDHFVATFLFHHFLSDEDIEWLGGFKRYNLSDEQAKALIFIREVGAINNAAYRNLVQTDTLSASTALRQLRDLGLFVAREKGVATYYVLSESVNDRVLESKDRVLESKDRVLESKDRVLEPKDRVLESKDRVLESKDQVEKSEISNIVTINDLPDELKQCVKNLGKKSRKESLEKVIIALCSWREMTSEELASVLNRNQERLVAAFLSKMVEKSSLEYRFPQMPKHPNQAYRVKKL